MNSWTSNEELLSHLTLALKGPAAKVLRYFGETSPTALTDLWARLKHRFGEVVMRRFEARRQSETESVVEFEQALRVLYREAWSTAPANQRDSALKRRFEDGVYLPELSQYLRLHCRDLNFEQTVKQARICATIVESTKPKNFARFVGDASTPPGTKRDLTPLVDQSRWRTGSSRWKAGSRDCYEKSRQLSRQFHRGHRHQV